MSKFKDDLRKVVNSRSTYYVHSDPYHTRVEDKGYNDLKTDSAKAEQVKSNKAEDSALREQINRQRVQDAAANYKQRNANGLSYEPKEFKRTPSNLGELITSSKFTGKSNPDKLPVSEKFKVETPFNVDLEAKLPSSQTGSKTYVPSYKMYTPASTEISPSLSNDFKSILPGNGVEAAKGVTAWRAKNDTDYKLDKIIEAHNKNSGPFKITKPSKTVTESYERLNNKIKDALTTDTSSSTNSTKGTTNSNTSGLNFKVSASDLTTAETASSPSLLEKGKEWATSNPVAAGSLGTLAVVGLGSGLARLITGKKKNRFVPREQYV